MRRIHVVLLAVAVAGCSLEAPIPCGEVNCDRERAPAHLDDRAPMARPTAADCKDVQFLPADVADEPSARRFALLSRQEIVDQQERKNLLARFMAESKAAHAELSALRDEARHLRKEMLAIDCELLLTASPPPAPPRLSRREALLEHLERLKRQSRGVSTVQEDAGNKAPSWYMRALQAEEQRLRTEIRAIEDELRAQQ
jgi:hypothetical protein